MATAVKSTRRDRERMVGAGKMAETALAPSSPKSPAYLDEVSAAVAAALSSQFTALHEKMDGLQSSVDALGSRLREAEDRLGQAEDKMETLTREVADLKSQVESQATKLDDLENRSRRKNLRIMGIPEAVTDKDLLPYLDSLIAMLLKNVELDDPLQIERAHRVGPVQTRDSRPRIVLVKFLRFPQKERILRAARQLGEVVYNNSRLRIAQDYSIALSRRRRDYAPLCEKLIQAKIRFTVQYPARLHVTHEGVHRAFDSAAAAQPYVDQLAARERVAPTLPAAT